MENYFQSIQSVESLHHAILFEANRETGFAEIMQTLEHLTYPTKGNPDLWIEKYDLLAVDDAREIRKAVSLRPVRENIRVCVIQFLFATPEAQQALLKTLEELPKHMRMILITPRATLLLPTVLSRLIVVASQSANDENSEFLKFVTLPIHARMEFVKKFIDDHEDLTPSETKYDALILINTVESELYKKWNKKDSAIFQRISKLREYLFDPGSSVKMILEEMAILVS